MNLYIGICSFIIGSVLASFYGVVATRLPENKSVLKPRSHCLNCNHVLIWYELIPIFSYLFSKGKCRVCGITLPIYEPIMELVTGLLFMFFSYYYGLSYSLWISWILVSLLDLIFISDLKYMIILDSPLIISSIFIFLLKWFYLDIYQALWSLLFGFVLFIFMDLVGKVGTKLFKREALGGGDIKLSFVIGLLVGIPHGFMVLILSTFLALPYATYSLLSNTNHEVPYGPFLISSLFIVFLFYDKFNFILMLLYH